MNTELSSQSLLLCLKSSLIIPQVGGFGTFYTDVLILKFKQTYLHYPCLLLRSFDQQFYCYYFYFLEMRNSEWAGNCVQTCPQVDFASDEKGRRFPFDHDRTKTDAHYVLRKCLVGYYRKGIVLRVLNQCVIIVL